MTKSPLSSFYFPHFRSSKPNLSILSFSVFFRTWFSPFILARPPLPWETCFLDAIPYPRSEHAVIMSISVTHISINQKKTLEWKYHTANIKGSYFGTRLLIRPKNLLWSVSRNNRRQRARFCTVPGPRDISRSEFRGRVSGFELRGRDGETPLGFVSVGRRMPACQHSFSLLSSFFCVFFTRLVGWS